MSGGLQRFENLVGGTPVGAGDGGWIESLDPCTGAPWAEIPRCAPADVLAVVGAAHAAFTGHAWRGLKPTARGKLLWKLADLIERDAEKLARLEVRDNGKLFAEMHGQLRYIPEWYRYFGGLADKVEGSVIPTDKADVFNYTLREPLGVIAMITPWNSSSSHSVWATSSRIRRTRARSSP